MATEDDLTGLKGDARIVAEAKSRFDRCVDYESTARKRFVEDVKFDHGDSDNMWQWPDRLQSDRSTADKPMLTINKVHQHNLMILNDAKMNKPSVTIRPTGDQATYDAAQIFEGVVRNIEYQSNAEAAYDTATMFQVSGGIGYWRIVTDYAGDDNFDQEIFIRRIKDPLSVYLDPDCSELDKSDARFGFIFDDMPKDEYEASYPKHKDAGGEEALGNTAVADSWFTDKHVRVAEYYRCVEKKNELIAYQDHETGQMVIAKRDKLDKELFDSVIDSPSTKRRNIVTTVVEHYIIAGDKIIERNIWPGSTVPIVALIGEEIVIAGQMDRKGHTRAMKDPQRIYNYWSSAAVEFVALQTKSPFIAPAQAIEGNEEVWANANRVNYSILAYNHVDDEGNPIPKPERANPPVMADAYIKGMQISAQEMMYVSGQYQAMMGAPSNEQSGKAINERQRQGDRATYHFIDNLAHAIRRTGKILIELIPKIYDTKRVIRIQGEDGTENFVQIDPEAQQALVQKQAQDKKKVEMIFNPAVGKYDVQADIGPAYATKRQEAFNAFTQIVSQNPELVGVVGDLMFRSADFPLADKIAERLERMVPPQAKGDGPSPQEAQMGQQIQHMQQLLTTTMQQLAEEKLKGKSKEADKSIGEYDAITRRIAALEKHMVSPRLETEMLHDLAMQEHSGNINAQQSDQSHGQNLDMQQSAADIQAAQMAAQPEQPQQGAQ